MKTLFILIFLININTSFSQLPPTLLPGYPLVVDSTQGTYNSGASPIVADFNNDGENEILICVNLDLLTGSVYLMDIHGNVKPNFPIEVSCINSYMNSAVGDVDGDGFLDIVVKADSLYVFNFNGSLTNGFPAYFENSLTSLGDRLAIYDLDNNGNLEIILGRAHILSVYNSNGQVRNGWPKYFNIDSLVAFVSFPTIGDLNFDNIPEIIMPVSYYNYSILKHDSNKIYIYEPDGSLYLNPVINSDSNYFFRFNPAVIFKNKQKDSTFFVINSNNSPTGAPNSFKSRVTIYNSAGNLVNRFHLVPRFVLGQISMGDLDGDSIPDIVFGNSFSQVYAYNLKGNLFPGYPVFSNNYEYRSSSIGKLSENNCIMTMSWLNTTNYLQSFNNEGVQLTWSPLYPVGPPLCAVTFCDLDNDKNVDFLVTTFTNIHTTGLYAWTMQGINYNSEDFPWPMYAHDRYRTNQYGFIPPDEPVGIQPISTNVPDKFSLSQNYPNPFNPATTIKFDIRTPAFTKLTVFDVLGREIQTLVNEELKTGSYSLVFDGSDFNSGVYFYRLTSGDFVETKRMLMVK